jgi:hypothetical protein
MLTDAAKLQRPTDYGCQLMLGLLGKTTQHADDQLPYIPARKLTVSLLFQSNTISQYLHTQSGGQ